MNIEDLISQYIDGELTSEAEAELHHRLSVSPEDRELFREHIDLRDAARSRQLQHQPTRSMEMSLFARLAAEEGAEIPERIEPAEIPMAAKVPVAAELRPLEDTPAPVPATYAADARPVRSEREPARRRRLIPLLVPFVFGVIATALFWQFSRNSADTSGQIAANNSTGPSVIAQAPPPETSTPGEGASEGAIDESAPSATGSVESPLFDDNVSSDAGPSYGRRWGKTGSGPSRDYRSPAPKAGWAEPEESFSASGSGYGDGAGMASASEVHAPVSVAPPVVPSPPPAEPRLRRESPDQNLGNRRGEIPPRDLDEAEQQSVEKRKDDEDRALAQTSIEYQTQVQNGAAMSSPRTTAASAPDSSPDEEAPRQSAVPPSTMRGGMAKPTVPQNAIAPPEGTISQLGDAYFDSDRATLRSESRSSLNLLADLLNSYPTMRIEIQGHTDSDGNDDRNNELSEGRARAVKEYLVRRGISAERMQIQGYGASAPLAPNTTTQGRKLNRRVVVVVRDYGFRATNTK